MPIGFSQGPTKTFKADKVQVKCSPLAIQLYSSQTHYIQLQTQEGQLILYLGNVHKKVERVLKKIPKSLDRKDCATAFFYSY